MKRSRRDLLTRVAALTLASGIPGRAARAQQPIRVGFSIAQTGPISGGGHPRLAQYLRTNEMQTIVGPVRYRKDGEWANPRIITTQFQGVKDKDIEQFKKPGVQVILHPDSRKNGTLRAPFEKAHA